MQFTTIKTDSWLISTTTSPVPPLIDYVTPDTARNTSKPVVEYSDKIMEPLHRLHITTPLIESHALSKLTGFPVYLKLENVQPVGSFKIRGVGNLCQKVWYYSSCYKLSRTSMFLHNCKTGCILLFYWFESQSMYHTILIIVYFNIFTAINARKANLRFARALESAIRVALFARFP